MRIRRAVRRIRRAIHTRAHLQLAHDLKERVPIRPPLDGQRIHQNVERQFLVRQVIRQSCTGASHEAFERLIADHICAMDDGVDEEAGDSLQFLTRPTTHRDPDGNRCLHTEPAQHDGESCQQRGEEGRRRRARERAQPGGDVGGNPERKHLTSLRSGRRTRMIVMQFQVREPLEPMRPVRREGFQPSAGQRPTLPHGVVGVLQGRFGKHQHLATHPCQIHGVQIFNEDPNCLGVGDDVVNHEREEPLAITCRPDSDAGEWCSSQNKWLRCALRQDTGRVSHVVAHADR